MALKPQLLPSQAPLQPPHNYWFTLGRQPLLSIAEIKAFFCLSDNNISNNNTILKISLPKIEPNDIIKLLGGTIKIAEELGINLLKEDLENIVIKELDKLQGKIHFGLSFYGDNQIGLSDLQKLGLTIKKSLKQQGKSVRYVQNREKILSSAVVKNNKLIDKGIEFIIDCNKNVFSIAKTIAVQPFEKFSERDYGRPGRDDFSGMLPPKLSMIMINLSQTKKNGLLLDPFCGSGTIITEALIMGYKNLIGTDVSDQAIKNTEDNLDWTEQNYKLDLKNYKIDIEQCDIKELSNHIETGSVDAILTEPYMGKPLKGKESKQELFEQSQELRELYIIAFEQFAKIIKKNGIVVFIIPRFKYKDNWVVVDILKEIKKLGFLSKPLLPDTDYLLYHRPNQFVGREIWRFVKR